MRRPPARLSPSPQRSPSRRLSLLAGPLLGLLLLTGAGCGLFSEDIGWRAYPLRGIAVDDATELVRDVVRTFCTERFGGVEIEWDATLRNLRVDGIHDDERELRLRLHIEPAEDGVDVEMLALVYNLVPGKPPKVWGDPKQDVPLEELLYDAMLAEYLERRTGG